MKVRNVMNGEVITWSCHICGHDRPDSKISVIKHPLIIRGQTVGEQNVRYCNDRAKCAAKAVNYRFYKDS